MARGVFRFFCGLAMAGCLLGPVLAATQHDDGKARDAQPPFPGHGHTAGTLAPDQGSILGMATQGVGLYSWLSLQDLPGQSGRASDIWGHVSPTGREYALIGLERGTAFVDITNPSQPVVAGHIASPASIWKEVSSYGEYAYVVTEAGGGMQVIDLRRIDQHVVTLVQTVTTPGLNRVHTIRVNPASGTLYLNGSNLYNGGLVAYDATNPANPQFAGAWDDTYVHDSVIVTYASGPYAGREIAFACLGQVGLGILDVTDKANMTTLSISTYPHLAYCHYAWLDEDRHYLYVNDEFDETTYTGLPTTTYVFDVTNLASPQYVTSFTNGNSAIDHNPIGRGDFLFEANYRSGLRVYDISNLQAVHEVGYFDTYPADDLPNFNGAWGVHLLPSGTVIVSDMERGLFVFDVSEATGADSGNPPATERVRLSAFPNPVRDRVTLGFELPERGPAVLSIVNVEGRVVKTLSRSPAYPTRTRVTWELAAERERPAAGTYYAVLDTPRGRKSTPFVILR